jgi:hypothetical protein
MEWIDLYVKEVGRNLPEKMRADIEQELRSMIEDTLEDESGKQGRPVDDAMVVAVLKRLGPPRKVAASYLPPRYLVGPELFPTYLFTLRVVMTVLVAIAVVFFGISLGLSIGQPVEVGQAITQSFGQALEWFLNTIIWAAGIITLVYALIQWSAPQTRLPSLGWDPRSLKSKPDPERINRGGMIAEMVMTLVALALFNIYPQWVGIASMVNGHWVVVPILSPAFLQFIPWFSLLWGLSILVSLAVVVQGRWTATTHWEQVALDVFAIVLSYRILTGAAIIAFPPDMISRLGWGTATPQAIQSLSQVVNTMLRVAVGLGLIAQVIKVIKMLYRLLIKGRFSEAMRMG